MTDTTTPRTDAIESRDRADRPKLLWDLCATLERELSAAQAQIAALEAKWSAEVRAAFPEAFK